MLRQLLQWQRWILQPAGRDIAGPRFSQLIISLHSFSLSLGLASSLQPAITEDLYFSFDQEEILRSSNKGIFVEDVDKELMKRSVITPDFERKERAPAMSQSRYTLQKTRKVYRHLFC